eukprot:5533220-Prymnesium_polylepis.1
MQPVEAVQSDEASSPLPNDDKRDASLLLELRSTLSASAASGGTDATDKKEDESASIVPAGDDAESHASSVVATEQA